MTPSFPMFQELPTELRHLIWEKAALGANKYRLLLMDDERDRSIRVSRHLKSSSIFSTNSESRQVAKRIYSTRLHVYKVVEGEVDDGAGIGEDADYMGMGFGERDVVYKGEVYINPRLDTFVIIRSTDDWYQEEYALASDFTDCFTGRMNRAQCAQIENIMEIDSFLFETMYEEWECQECRDRYSPQRCPGCGGIHDGLDEFGLDSCEHEPPLDEFLNGLSGEVDHNFLRKHYPGVRSCKHIWLDAEDGPDIFLRDVCEKLGQEVLQIWSENIRHFDEEKMTPKPKPDKMHFGNSVWEEAPGGMS